MNLAQKARPRESGSAYVTVVVFASILMITTASLIQLASARFNTSYNRWNWNESYFHAENVIQWAGQQIADVAVGNSTDTALGKYSVANGNISLTYLSSGLTGASAFSNAWLTIENDPSGTVNLFRVTASAMVGKKVRTVQAQIRKGAPSYVFDYEYFLNNWGWWWGSTITGQGDNRANWDFDFRFNPTVNGSVVANGNIEQNGVPVDPLSGTVPFVGLASTDPSAYVHSGSPRLLMPNLQDFSYYQQKATAAGSTLYVGTNLLVSAYRTNATTPGLYLVGTPANPIKINGPVVIPGDVVIKGTITGVGTLYVGGSLYIAGDLTYGNSPDFSTPPGTMTAVNQAAWVQNNLSNSKDLIAFAVRESVFGGAPNSSAWKSAVYDPSGYGLSHVGDESQLGQDGIAGTPDDSIAFTHADGTSSAWYDADGDGVVDHAYSYINDIQMNASRAANISGYPTTSGTPDDFNTLSSNNMNRIDGVIYCNHAVGMRAANPNLVWNGTVVCRDEAIIFSSTAKFVYDPRIHSRYTGNPNQFVDLGLPTASGATIESLIEIAPVSGWITSSVAVK
ncbi:MAG: hypothetical protein HY043_04015 [Verrucomicrobia bacterium]|nr:hypothetical protein [Verrucomicrobiota bacterium]